ncbi:T6SS amidase immunity protein Tai4 family protein [Ralstonia pseudosolanacearum]|uniref:T6SS amidase immunity protein Tai4 family protein n=1 Tax=Ralstonia pseudosolanacearum TaxID=1310165 RepID=UPI003398FD2D
MLARNYADLLADADIRERRFGLLKCLDRYHSRELGALARQLGSHPGAQQSIVPGAGVERRVQPISGAHGKPRASACPPRPGPVAPSTRVHSPRLRAPDAAPLRPAPTKAALQRG